MKNEVPSLLTRAAVSFLAAAPIVVFFFLLLRRRLLQKGQQPLPPGNLGLPLFGEMPSYIHNPLRWSLDRAHVFGTPFLSHIFFTPMIIVGSNDDDVKWVWDSERKGLASVSHPVHIRNLFGRGSVAAASGARHRSLRRLLGPAFAPASVGDYVDIMDKTVGRELERWASPSSAGGGDDNFHSSSEFKGFAFRILIDCVFPDADEDVVSRVQDEFHMWLDGFNSYLPFPLPGTLLGKAMAARGRLLGLIRNLIREFQRDSSSSVPSRSSEENEDEEAKKKKTLLGSLCYGTDAEGNRLSMEDMCDNILVILFAGHDTTCASLGSLLHNISLDQRVASALIEEVSAENFTGPKLDFNELKNNAPVLNAVMAESWRKDPPVPIGGAKILHGNVSYKKWTFPKNMKLLYNIILGAYNERRYPKPHEFKIDRFLPKEHPLVTDVNLHADGVDYNAMSPAFSIFGGGNHSCIGSHFARLEARIILTRMFQRYNVEVRDSKKVNFPFNAYTVQFRLTPRLADEPIEE